MAQRITKRVCDAATVQARRSTIWDSDLKGFGLRIAPTGTRTFICRYRAGGGRAGLARELVIGRYGPLTAEDARDLARKALAEVAKGGDPQSRRAKARADMTVAELCDLYRDEGCATKKPSTLVTDRARLEGHVKPLLGRKRVGEVTAADVDRFMRDVAAGKSASPQKLTMKALRASGMSVEAARNSPERRRRNDPVVTGGKGAATRTLGLLGAVFEFAVDRKLRPDNPARGVKRYAEQRYERFLSPAELARLGEALGEMKAAGAHPYGLAAIRLLALTGARKGEIEGLRWGEVDFDRGALRLADSKTGRKALSLSPAGAAVLAGVESDRRGEFVFPARSGGGHYQGTPHVWEKARAKAGLDDVRLHDLRHTFASFGAAGGFGLPVIGALLGHRQPATTARYAHLADDPLRLAAERIGDEISAALKGTKGAQVVQLRR